MPTKEALRGRIELVESRLHGQPVRVINLRLRSSYALADLLVDGVRKLNRRYNYKSYFKASKLRSFA
jgi:hypothetical protein